MKWPFLRVALGKRGEGGWGGGGEARDRHEKTKQIFQAYCVVKKSKLGTTKPGTRVARTRSEVEMVEMASCRIGANVPGAAGVSSRRTSPKEESELRAPSPELMVDLMLGTLHLVHSYHRAWLACEHAL